MASRAPHFTWRTGVVGVRGRTYRVSAVAAGGSVLENLAPAQFRVTEDGVPAAVLGVEGGGAGSVAVCLALDRSGSMDNPARPGTRKLDAALEASQAFVRALRPGDRAAVI